ncbi:MAG: hypothetical protein COA42_18985 [Alteromonadaceae bacterium]|nr:MAG: hypothetical protein COA42_18985 [Alteromonadaceae bacterium]
MLRPIRIEFSGALYHVTSRGNARADIYLSEQDRSDWLGVLGDVCRRYNWVCHAYCLMGNHYHLLVETPESNLSLGMRHLNGVYTQKFNRKHGCVVSVASYLILRDGFRGQSIGKRLFRLGVLFVISKKRCNVKAAVFRSYHFAIFFIIAIKNIETATVVLLMLIVLDLFLIVFTSQGSLSDRFAKTAVYRRSSKA